MSSSSFVGELRNICFLIYTQKNLVVDPTKSYRPIIARTHNPRVSTLYDSLVFTINSFWESAAYLRGFHVRERQLDAVFVELAVCDSHHLFPFASRTNVGS